MLPESRRLRSPARSGLRQPQRHLQATGGLAEAEAAARQSLAIEPASPVNLCNLAAALIGLGEFERASGALLTALALEPNHVASLGNWAGVLRQQGKRIEAIDLGRCAVALDPDYAVAHYNLALALADSGEAEESQQGLSRAIALDSTWADAHFGLAEGYLRRGDFAPGWEEYEWRWRLKEYDWIKAFRIRKSPGGAGRTTATKRSSFVRNRVLATRSSSSATSRLSQRGPGA